MPLEQCPTPTLAYWYIDSINDLNLKTFQSFSSSILSHNPIFRIYFSNVSLFPPRNQFDTSGIDLLLFESRDALICDIMRDSIQYVSRFGSCKVVLGGEMSWHTLATRLSKQNVSVTIHNKDEKIKNYSANGCVEISHQAVKNETLIDKHLSEDLHEETHGKMNDTKEIASLHDSIPYTKEAQHRHLENNDLNGVDIIMDVKQSQNRFADRRAISINDTNDNKEEQMQHEPLHSGRHADSFKVVEGQIESVNDHSFSSPLTKNGGFIPRENYALSENESDNSSVNDEEESLVEVRKKYADSATSLKKSPIINRKNDSSYESDKQFYSKYHTPPAQNASTPKGSRDSDISINWHEWGKDNVADIEKLRIMMSGKSIMTLEDVLTFCHEVYEVSREVCNNYLRNILLNEKKVFRVEKSNGEVFITLHEEADLSSSFGSEEDSILLQSKRKREQTDEQISALKLIFQNLMKNDEDDADHSELISSTQTNTVDSFKEEAKDFQNRLTADDIDFRKYETEMNESKNKHTSGNFEMSHHLQENGIDHLGAITKDNDNDNESMDELNHIADTLNFNDNTKQQISETHKKYNHSPSTMRNETSEKSGLRLLQKDDLPLIQSIVSKENEIELEELKEKLEDIGIATTHLELFLIPYSHLFNMQQTLDSCIVSLHK